MPLGTRTNVRARSTRFIGRARDLAEIRARLGDLALVVVLGPPGVGKTRLAQEHARSALAEYPGGAFRCDLAEARDANDVCASIAGALDVPLTGHDTGALVAQLADAIAARGRALFVLDTFEHLVALAPTTIEVLRERAPAARFLITSRVRTHLEGESLLDLEPLSTPGDDTDIEASEAVQLFVERARHAQKGYALTPEEAPRVAALARELDGLPLAIELAAARLRIFSTATLLDSMNRRLDVLSARPGVSVGRHASLRAAIETSWAALEDHERAALAQCSVFRGTFDLQAAERVIDLGPGSPWIPDVMHALRDQSLLLKEEDRFRLLVAIRDFAGERLAEGREAAAAESRHDAYYLAEGRALALATNGPDQIEVRRKLASEAQNLVAVHRRALARGDAERAAEAALALQPHYHDRGPLPCSAQLLDPIVDAHLSHIDAHLSARVLAARAEVHRTTGNIARCLEDGRRALEVLGDRGDVETRGAAHLTLAAACCWHHRSAEAEPHWRALEGLASSARGGDRVALRLAGRHKTLLGAARILDGMPSEARDLLCEARAIHEALGDLRFIAITESNLCLASTHLGRFDEAREHGERASALTRAVGNRRNAASTLTFLGAIALERDDLERAEEIIGEAESMSREMGDRYQRALARFELGVVHLAAGRRDLARASFERGLHVFRGADNPWVAAAHAWLGAIAAIQRDVDAARASFSEAERLRGAHGGFGAGEVVDVLRGFLDLALAGLDEGDAERASAHRASAEKRRDAATAPLTYVRVARRLLDRAIAAANPSLVVHASGRWFHLPSGRRVDCAKKRVLPLLLVALARHRLSAPGAPLSTTALSSAGWPGDRADARSTQSRLYVAVNTLRNMGLREILQSDARGYFLDPEVPVRLALEEA
jgi:predicted ATPase